MPSTGEGELHRKVLYQGRIVKSGDFSLVKQLEEQGYGWLTEQQ